MRQISNKAGGILMQDHLLAELKEPLHIFAPLFGFVLSASARVLQPGPQPAS